MIKVIALCACFTISRSVTAARRPNHHHYNLQHQHYDQRHAKSLPQGCGTELHILVSPLVSGSSIKELVVFWNSREWREGDRVGLTVEGRAAADLALPGRWGLATTGHHLHNVGAAPWLPCSQVRATYRTDSGTVLATACLQARPTWMHDIKEHIKGLTLAQTFIPGTHNSGSYILSNTGYKETLASKYIYTQDETVLNQLLHGGRYLDLRVGRYSRGQEWWLNHDIFSVHPLSDILHQIKQFVNATKEIVILDFHGFPVGFNGPRVHRRFAAYLTSELGRWLSAPPSLNPWQVSLGQLWASDRRIVLSYNNAAISKEFNFYPPIMQKWGDKDTLPQLESYLESIMPRNHDAEGRVWAAMAQLTPRALGVLLDEYGGLRRMAQVVNRQLDGWLRNRAWSPNVVAVDFLRSTAVVPLAVAANLARARAPAGNNCSYPSNPARL